MRRASGPTAPSRRDLLAAFPEAVSSRAVCRSLRLDQGRLRRARPTSPRGHHPIGAGGGPRRRPPWRAAEARGVTASPGRRAADTQTGHGARRIADAFAERPRRRAARRSSRMSSPATPMPRQRRHRPARRSMPAPTSSRSGCPTATRSPTARRSSVRRTPRSGGRLARGLASRLIEQIGAARPDVPLVPMGYANQVIGGGDGEAVGCGDWPVPAQQG